MGIEPIKSGNAQGPESAGPFLGTHSGNIEPDPLTLDPNVGAAATAWATELRPSQPKSTERAASPSEGFSTNPGRESVVTYLYRGNFQNFGMSMTATAISSGVTALVGVIATRMGMTPGSAAVLVAASSYVWYPVYFGLNHVFHDRAVAQSLAAQGDSGVQKRMWGHRITQLLVGDGIWLGAIIPLQLFWTQHFSMTAANAAVASHLPLALVFNVCLMTPLRNLSAWLWKLDRPQQPR